MSDSAKSVAFVRAMATHIKSGGEFVKIHCDNSGLCTAAETSDTISNCKYCGKELIWKNGNWWTWDSDIMESSQPQKGDAPNET